MKYVTYFRVSTRRQGESGLGLAAQKRDISLFLENYAEVGYEILGEFTDVESGTKDDRKGFVAAVALAKKYKAELLVAKLDRISRKVSTIARTMEEVKVRVAVMPLADNFQLHIYAALAEQEREFISQRTKSALKEAKAKGVKLGAANENWKKANRGMAEKQRRRTRDVAIKHAEKYRKEVEMMISMRMALDPIAQKLKELKLYTLTDKPYTASGVKNLCRYLGLEGKTADERYNNMMVAR